MARISNARRRLNRQIAARVLVSTHNRDAWIARYLYPPAVDSCSHYLVKKRSFVFKVSQLLMKLQQAVYNDDWSAVGELIADIDIDFVNVAGNNEDYSEYSNFLFGHRWPQIFYCLFQRLLKTTFPVKVKAMTLELALKKMEYTVKTPYKVSRNMISQYITSVLIYAIAHYVPETIDSLQNFKILPKHDDFQFQAIRTVYIAMAKYQRLYNQKAPAHDYQWRAVYDIFQEYIERLEPENLARALIFIEPLIVIANKIEEDVQTLNFLTNICTNCPALLPFAATAYAYSSSSNFAGTLVSRVIRLSKSSFLYRFNLIVHFVCQRYIHGFEADTVNRQDLEENVRMLLTFLDYGRNRGCVEAWTALHLNLVALDNAPPWLLTEWEERMDWWPDFHVVELPEKPNADRKAVFKFFRKAMKRYQS